MHTGGILVIEDSLGTIVIVGSLGIVIIVSTMVILAPWALVNMVIVDIVMTDHDHYWHCEYGSLCGQCNHRGYRGHMGTMATIKR